MSLPQPLPQPQSSLEPLALAAQLVDWRGAPSSSQYINELLRDVRSWRKLDAEEAAARLAADPLALLAAWELAYSSELAQRALSDAEFLRRFNRPDILRGLVHLAFDAPEGLELPRTWIVSGGGLPAGLHMAQCMLRWAQRFAHWRGGLDDLRRINLQHPFAVVVAPRRTAPAVETLLHILTGLGVRVERIDPEPEPEALREQLAALLGVTLPRQHTALEAGEYTEAGGTRNSIYVVRAIGGVDGFDVRGLVGPDLGLIIDIGDREVSVAQTAYLEAHAVQVINTHTPLEAERAGDSLRLRWAGQLEAEDLGRIIHGALKREFLLDVVSVNLIFDPLRIGSLRPAIYAYREDRESKLKKRSEDNSPIIACRSCAAYAPHVFCMVTPDRQPCCGRSYDELAALAQFTPALDQLPVERGNTQDRASGRYVGTDKLAALFSEGRITRLHLHGLRESPHPTTAIPQCVAWLLDGPEIAGVVSADYLGRTPDGRTFESLLARAAGRQIPGMVGVSEEYASSARFLAGEGGLARIGWMNSALKTRLGIRAGHILTENECTTLAALREQWAAWRN